ncbi:hypothetical protein ACU8KH_00017 [Lachancea thermotolerans]
MESRVRLKFQEKFIEALKSIRRPALQKVPEKSCTIRPAHLGLEKRKNFSRAAPKRNFKHLKEDSWIFYPPKNKTRQRALLEHECHHKIIGVLGRKKGSNIISKRSLAVKRCAKSQIIRHTKTYLFIAIRIHNKDFESHM